MVNVTQERAGRLASDDPQFKSALNQRIAEMRLMLDALAVGSPAEALKALREAFPEASLDERVRAVISSRH
jgi:hypothetical protein